MNINILFIIVMAIFVIGAVWGYRRGLLEGIIGIVSCILGLIVIVIIAKGIGNFIQGSFFNVLMALALLAAIRIIYKIVKLLADSLKLVRALPAGKLVDGIAGAVLGLAEAVFVVWVLFILIGSFDLFHLNAWIHEQVGQSRFLTLVYYSNYLVVLLKQI